MAHQRSKSEGVLRGHDRRCGSQPSRVDIYPRLPEWLYRTMLADFEDLLWTEPARNYHWQHESTELHKEHYFMRQLVIHCITGDGPSKLMLACIDFAHGRKWFSKAEAYWQQKLWAHGSNEFRKDRREQHH